MLAIPKFDIFVLLAIDVLFVFYELKLYSE